MLTALPSGPSADTPRPPAPAAVTADHSQLQRDADMTQQMSTPTADGPMQNGLIQEPMRQRAEDPGYVRALEQHQADIDRMLARNQ